MSKTEESDVILSLDNISKSFPGVRALDHVSLQVKRGSVHGLVGENGAGKSTLMKCLMGVYKKDEGKITFDGEVIENARPADVLRKGLSIVFQEFNLVNNLSIGENIFLGRYNEMGSLKNIHKKAAELLKVVDCNYDTHTNVGDIRTSEKQKVEIAKAISFDCKLIIFDEPSSSLTNAEFQHFTKLIRQLRDEGMTIIYISHRLEEIFELCDMVTILRDGQVVETKPVAEVTRKEMIAKMIGREQTNEFPPRPECVKDEVILSVEDLCTNRLHHISFELKKGEILGLAGLDGAGRTLIARAIFGADKRTSGKICIEGKEVQIRNTRDAIKAGMGFITEDRKEQGLVLNASVEQNISIASLNNILGGHLLNKEKERKMAEKYVDALDIKTPSLRQKVILLSGGNQQKCIIGRWCEIEPKILIMDEPTRGIDVSAKYEIYVIMKNLVESGNSIIFISSDLSEIMNMSNRVLTVSEGALTGEFDPRVLTADTIMDAAFK